MAKENALLKKGSIEVDTGSQSLENIADNF